MRDERNNVMMRVARLSWFVDAPCATLSIRSPEGAHAEALAVLGATKETDGA
jgi:hypothetical protein